MKHTPDIDAQSVEFAIKMHERAAVDAEFSKHYQRQLDERQARDAFVERIVDGLDPHRLTTLELCCFLAVALASVAVIAFTACEIIRLVKTHGF
jgi:hypothetical protein